MKKYTCYLFLVLGITSAALLYSFGRSYWYPICIKIRGAKTTSAVITKIKEHAKYDYDLDRWETLTLLCFKDERKIEVWVAEKSAQKRLVREFPFTGFSGKLGPKLREGDRQIPEGIYKIEYLNPNSSYHLSMKINYPNDFDIEKGISDDRKKLGHDIFIHGKSATVGCIPIGDSNIEELFFMVAVTGVSNVQVIIAPYDMRKQKRDIEIPEIGWEHELYSRIESSLKLYEAEPVGMRRHSH